MAPINLHAGGQLVTINELKAAPLPEATKSHVPLAHSHLVDVVKHWLTFYSHEVVEEHHALDKEGMRYFGLLTLRSDYEDKDYTDTLIMRNSNDKAFPISIGLGSRVFLCSNLAFVANHVVKRRHTARSRHELPALISELVEPLAEEREAQHRKLLTYKATDLSDQLAHHAIMRMYREDVINCTRIPDVINEWEKPTHEWGEKKVWRLFNAATYALNGRVAENPAATAHLHKILDDVVELA